jgi:tubulin--tyrosine ligase
VKPANENQGKGIRIFSDKDQIHRFLETSIKFSYWVIQKYIERPLLYKGRKFDIRVWAFAQSNLDFYFYDTGYIRTSSGDFDMANVDDELTHLTNNCL